MNTVAGPRIRAALDASDECVAAEQINVRFCVAGGIVAASVFDLDEGPVDFAAAADRGDEVVATICADIARQHGLPPDWINQLNPRPDLLESRFAAGVPDRAWCSDITHVRAGEGWLYLAVVLDVGSCRLLGYQMSGRIDTQLVDVVGAFFPGLKRELVHRRRYPGRAAARRSIFEWLTRCNTTRRHTSLDNGTPDEHEAHYRQTAGTAPASTTRPVNGGKCQLPCNSYPSTVSGGSPTGHHT